MKFKENIILATVFALIAIGQESALYAQAAPSEDTEAIKIESVESILLTVFLPVGSQPGSYLLDGNIVVIPVAKTINIPQKATQINLPAQATVTIVRGASTENPVTETYVTVRPLEIANSTYEAVKDVERRIAPIGRNSGLPVLENFGLITDSDNNATDAN